MGGHIAVALRRRDGSTSCVGMRAGRMKSVFTDEEFMNGGLGPLEQEILHVLDDREFGFGPMAPVPGEYGMIVVDEILQRVVNWSRFDSVSRLAWYDLGFRGYGRTMAEDRYDDARAKALKYGDRLYHWDNDVGAFAIKDVALQESVEALAALIEAHASEDDLRSVPEACVVLRFPKWEVLELNHLHEQDFHFAKSAIEAFIPLDASDRLAWDQAYRALHDAD